MKVDTVVRTPVESYRIGAAVPSASFVPRNVYARMDFEAAGTTRERSVASSRHNARDFFTGRHSATVPDVFI
jgi:hypothetical protein